MLEESRPEVMAANKVMGRKLLAQKKKQTATARMALIRLAEIKEERGLSLADIEQATGISRGNLSRLWNNPTPNVTIETLSRIAEALHADLSLTVTAK